MIIYEKMNQRSEKWLNIRIGKLTASQASKIYARGKGLETLCQELANEKRTGKKIKKTTTPAMERGIILEEPARKMFEARKGIKVKEVGFVEEDEFCGCSPDGLIGDDSGIEIKCPQANTYKKYLNDKKIDPRYYAQIQMNMLLTGRSSWWYVVYNPDFTPKMIMREVKADKKYQQELRVGIEKGKARIKELLEQTQDNISQNIRTDSFFDKIVMSPQTRKNIDAANSLLESYNNTIDCKQNNEEKSKNFIIVKMFFIYILVSIILTIIEDIENSVSNTKYPHQKYEQKDIMEERRNINKTTINETDIEYIKKEKQKQYIAEYKRNRLDAENNKRYSIYGDNKNEEKNQRDKKFPVNISKQNRKKMYENMQNVEIITYNPYNNTYTITKP